MAICLNIIINIGSIYDDNGNSNYYYYIKYYY